MIVAIPNGMAYLATRSSGDRWLQLVMLVFSISVLLFFAYRWSRVRAELATGQLTEEELRQDFQRHLLGPPRLFYLWVAVNTAVIVLLTIIAAELGQAA